MDLDLIIREVKKQLPKNTDTDVCISNGYWKKYITMSGSYDERDYFSLYFKEKLTGEKEIEIQHTTDFPMKYISMIKDIDPKAVIAYYETRIVKIIN